MAVSSNPCASAVAHAVAKLLDISPENVKVDPPPRPDLGDYAVPAFTLLKGSKEAPADLALRIARSLPTDDYIASATATGPFVNVRINRSRAFRDLAASVATPEVLIPRRGEGEIVCIDYSSPNISKHLAYHHIRSTMIGHSLVKLHQAMGYQVVRINHLGDWGTTHGMLLAADAKWGHEYAGYPQLGVTELNDLYVRFREAMKSDPSLEAMGRAWFKRLEDGDPAVRARWQQFRETSWREFDRVYKMLDVEFDDLRGESFYEDKMPEILELLSRRDLLKESEGALVVHIPGEKTPMLIKTKDGTTLYATRDLAAALFRWRQYKFSRCLYVVDRGQSLHFRQLFACLKLLGFEWADRCLHVPFGLIRFGGKKTSTRQGNVVLLESVFQEAISRVKEIIAQTRPDLTEDQLATTARSVGVAAVIFANVLPQRDKDVEFDWDKAVSLSGDSGPYLQYTAARYATILRRAPKQRRGDPQRVEVNYNLLSHEAEWTVARRLLDFGDYVERATVNCEPHIVAHYLLELASDFSHWYTLGNTNEALRVLCDDEDTRIARLWLVRTVRTWLERGLRLLGMATPESI